jgi:starch synthase (maltosyl-transferring)
LAALGIDTVQPFEVEDLLTQARYTWRGARNYVELRPQEMPAHVFRVSPLVRHEVQPAAASALA